ncbi:MAG TPA: metal ABC transporter permease [Solirubrobacteraceae bacterium]|nr:metal ABC transporter permease [Solirubrobacteraceae bacterium]
MNPSFSANPITDLNELLQYPFMVNALAAATIVALVGALIGWFVVLRRESFVCHTLSVMSFPGASGAALAGLPLASGYFAFALAGALAIAFGSRAGARRSLSHESAVVGSVGAAALALGFLFLSLYGGVLESVETLLFGSSVGITVGQVRTLAVVGLLAATALAAIGRPLFYASIDEQAARADGVPVRALAIAFLVLLGLAVAAIAQIVGVLLTFALLVAPAATAQQLTSRIGLSLALAVALALVEAWAALTLSYFTNLSLGFYVTSIALALYAIARAARELRR